MPLVKFLHTFRNRIEGSAKKDQVRDLPDHRIRALTLATPGRPLVAKLTSEEIDAYRQTGTLEGPQAKVEPDSNSRKISPRRAPAPPGSPPSIAKDPRRETKMRTKAPMRVHKRGTQQKEPESPRPLARGSQTGQAAASSSSPEAPAPGLQITRQRGTRTPKQNGSRSTTPTS